MGPPFIDTVNWAKGYDSEGSTGSEPGEISDHDGVLVSPSASGATNWQAPSFNPDTGLFYVAPAGPMRCIT